MSRSSATAASTPGRSTFTTTSRPSTRARWTCPRLAAATGSRSKSSKSSSTGAPNSRLDDRAGSLGRVRRHLVLERADLREVRLRQDVGPGAEELGQLDERRSERGEAGRQAAPPASRWCSGVRRAGRPNRIQRLRSRRNASDERREPDRTETVGRGRFMARHLTSSSGGREAEQEQEAAQVGEGRHEHRRRHRRVDAEPVQDGGHERPSEAGHHQVAPHGEEARRRRAWGRRPGTVASTATTSPSTTPFTRPTRSSLPTRPRRRAARRPSSAMLRTVTASACVPELPPMPATIGMIERQMTRFSMVSEKK